MGKSYKASQKLNIIQLIQQLKYECSRNRAARIKGHDVDLTYNLY